MSPQTKEKDKNGNGGMSKTLVFALTIFSIFSSGWAACATMGLRDLSRIDKSGTTYSQDLSMRVTKLETAMQSVPEIKDMIRTMQKDLIYHMNATQGKSRAAHEGEQTGS